MREMMNSFQTEKTIEDNLHPEDTTAKPVDDEFLSMVEGGVNLYQQSEGLNRNSWFVTLLEKYLGLGLNEQQGRE